MYKIQKNVLLSIVSILILVSCKNNEPEKIPEVARADYSLTVPYSLEENVVTISPDKKFIANKNVKNSKGETANCSIDLTKGMQFEFQVNDSTLVINATNTNGESETQEFTRVDEKVIDSNNLFIGKFKSKAEDQIILNVTNEEITFFDVCTIGER